MSDKIYGLLGRTLGHSFSPPIHHALGNPAYALYPMEPEALEAFIKQENMGGLNVTIPYKRTVLPYADVISDEVQEIGATNCLVNRDGTITAYNTDMFGFMYMLQSAGISVSGKNCLILGTGGASVAILAALKRCGASHVVFLSRSEHSTVSEADSADGSGVAYETVVTYDTYENVSSYYDFDVIVNCTPVGMYPNVGVSPLSLDGFTQLSGVADIVYNPLRTALIMDAEERGIPVATGLSMLVAQAKVAHEKFFDCSVEDQLMASITSGLRAEAENIVLCGMPGSGKTSVAEALGALTGREVIDIDAEIVKTAGKSIPDIMAEDGQEVFRQLETDEIVKFGKESGKILSLGGGAVLFERNYRPLHQNGRIYWIRRDLGLLATDGRPLSKSREALEQMWIDRKPLYERFSDVCIHNDTTIADAANAILADFNQ